MDESAAAVIREDDADKNYSHNDDETCENNNNHPSPEDSRDGVGAFCCRDCGAAFREEAAYLEHRRLHPQQNTYLNSQSDAEKDNETPYLCTLCSLSFVEINELRSHLKNHNQTSLKESVIVNNSGLTKHHTYVCPDCGKSYNVIGYFLNHLRSHKQASKSVFNNLEHLKKKSFQCESCGRNYSRASALDAHRRCHEEKLIKSKNRSLGGNVETGESAAEPEPNKNQPKNDSGMHFKCSCGKRFLTWSRLKTHQRFSRYSRCATEEMKQKQKKSSSKCYCTGCKKTFRGHAALVNHQRCHAIHMTISKERFTCEECGKVFKTRTFYHKHQRLVHNAETPAKSFLHQVCQVQKKAFECKDCGRKFSRASALQSHQLQLCFKETDREPQTHPSLPHQDIISEGCGIKSEHSAASLEEKVQSETFPAASTEDESFTNDTDNDTESCEAGDFNVQVISGSESEDEAAQDLNPDLELLCESDQDVRDDAAGDVSPGCLMSKSDLKIVQIDFDQTSGEFELMESGAETQTAEQRLDCPECYRWFTNPTSLRVHRMWHGLRKRRQQNQGQSVACEPSNYEAQFKHTHSHSGHTQSSGLLNQAEALVKKTFACNECGDVFSLLSALVSHQLHHPKRKQFQCPDCMESYLHAASLSNHMKTCPAQKRANVSVSKKEYNPKKTLLGPKIYHCEQCGKGFWSLGAFSHHKQNQTECTELRLRKGLSGSLHSVNERSRSMVKVACPICGRKFRHKGIMALHMRRHENGNHRCEICNRSFRLFSSLVRHEVVHSDQLLPPPIKSFQHQVEQLKKNTYSCPDCGKLFSRAKALQFHMKSHGYESGSSPSSPQSMVKVKNLQCATCFAHFNNSASLRAHRKLCVKREGEIIVKTEVSKNDAVEMCSYSDTQQHSDQIKERPDIKDDGDIGEQQVETHASGGNVENPGSTYLKYKCNACDKSFSAAGALNFHKRIHIEDNESITKSNINQALMCKTPSKEESGKGLIQCSDCGRRFMTKSALGCHRWWHKVKQCSQSSRKEDNFKAVSHKTEDGPFQCQKCEKQFFNHRVLQRHQVFNPLCQIKTEPDLNRNEGTTSTPGLFSCHENEHCESLKVAERQGEALKPIPEHSDVNAVGAEASPPAVKPKPHQCPLCSSTFAKARGLHAHKWQAHSKTKKCKKKLSARTERSKSNSEVDKADDSGMVKSSTVGRGRTNVRADPQPERFISCLDCGEQCSSAASLLDHKKVCLAVKQESKAETESPEAAAEVPPALSRLPEHTVKCLFKCDKCGKAFQTEEQLGTHKNKAKSRPHCCALCCHGFWTESQLQQHLAWHDEVRFRLSAAVTSSPLRPNVPVAADKSFPFYPVITQPPLNPGGWWQREHKDERCGEAFLSQNALEKHRSQQCGNLYRCLVCSKTFSHVKDLVDHHQECMSGHRGQSDTPAAVSLGDTNGLNLS
ncbi:zinc finger protein 91 isoform X2 [Kryptolebias marmoratus]|uniref:zinc finger protein 91 isoform X2 n=1 Tax=Kryptolebias marmoratus TaxID=37003 RepID=UPI0007F92F4E|nr:zinc finger protein 91 isoform X2 [Kryptolebias marmoratus]